MRFSAMISWITGMSEPTINVIYHLPCSNPPDLWHDLTAEVTNRMSYFFHSALHDIR
jgi:hypothetical protein